MPDAPAGVTTRRRLLRWGSWFALVNAGGLALIGLRYLAHYAAPGLSVAWLYALVAYLGHVSALAYLPFLLLLVPLIALLPWYRLALGVGVAAASAGLSLALLDSLVFAENRYHLSVLTAQLLAPRTWAFVGFYFVALLAIESMLALWVWRRTARPPRRRLGRYLALGLGGCLLVSHVVHAYADAYYYVPVTAFTHYLPLYQPLDSRALARLGLVDVARTRERQIAAGLGRAPGTVLKYPEAPLQCRGPAPALNVLLLVVDAMRADALTAAVAPHLSAFAEGAVRFEHHYSGGNSSRAGMFSLFYGLPPTYWRAFAGVARPPVLMDLFRAHHYQLGIFVTTPVFRAVGLDRTALAHVPNLRQKTVGRTNSPHELDGIVTEDWRAWLDRRDPALPFFGFLYWDTAQAIDPPADYRPAFTPPPNATPQQRLYAEYRTAVHFVDSLAGRVLADLEQRGLLERTIVIVTSDHGMEFDENGQGFKGHGTAFSRYQMQTPLVVRWPGRAPGRVERRTSHYDLAPTLVGGLFGCSNPEAEYSSGHDLFSGRQWDWLIAASYGDFGLIQPDRVTVTYASGYYEVRDRDYRVAAALRLDRDAHQAALREMGRFFR
jgi:membrane-anchored protein YejM (alkaline phosphatase superfamily)